MCIIAIKNKKNRNFKNEELEQMFINNPDGAGFMYVENNKVKIDKGYMTFKDFKNHFDLLNKKFNNFKNRSLILHFRIGTSGTNSRKNCHPYPISKKLKDLQKTKINCDLGVVHNGIIREYTPSFDNKIDFNDTQNFIINYLAPLEEHWSDFYKNKRQLEALENVTNSKLAFLNKNGDVYLSGDFVENEDGLIFSNETFRKRSYSKDWLSDYNYNHSYDFKNDFEKLKSTDIILKNNNEYEVVGDRCLYFNYFDFGLYDKDYNLIDYDVDIFNKDFESIYY